MLEFLLNVSWQELSGAQLRFAWPPSVLAPVAALAVLVALLCSGYFPTRGEYRLTVLRAGLALVAVFVAARPELLLPRPDATSGAVAVLIDDSASMSIRDVADAGGERSRAQAARSAFAAGSGELARALEARFAVRYLHFDARLHEGPGDGADPRAVSDPLGATIEAVSGGDVAAVVLVSDGGQVSGIDERAVLARLRASGVPVHTLGVGDAQLAPDVSVQSLVLPPRVFAADEVDVQVVFAAAGLAGQRVQLTVSDNGVLAGERAIDIDTARFEGSITIPIRAHQAGLHRIEVRAATPVADRVSENDRLAGVLNVRAEPAKILHFEGEPRFEVKFLRRAVADDSALSLASLVRTGDNRYLRLGIGAEDELADGFPHTAEELFRYQVLVIGSVRAAIFSDPQLRLLEDFVTLRGGSVVFLGGSGAFAEGGWGASKIAAMLPVALATHAEPFNVAVRAVVTTAGRAHAVTRNLFADREQDQALVLPALAVINPLRVVKPGASILLQGDDGGASPLVMLAWQRFGAGRVAVLPARDTWRWRMHADVPVNDRTHELFWRRLLRWLAREVPSRTGVRVTPGLAAPGQQVNLEVTRRDEQWRALREASARVAISTPLGDIVERTLLDQGAGSGADEGSSRDGSHSGAGPDPGPEAGNRADASVYTTVYAARDQGIHEVRALTEDDAQGVARALLASDDAAGLMISAAGEEFLTPQLRDDRLQRIASATGGSYRSLPQAGNLAERIAASVPVMQSWQGVALWNAPLVLFTLLTLACAEWWLRRRRRQLP